MSVVCLKKYNQVYMCIKFSAKIQKGEIASEKVNSYIKKYKYYSL